MKVYIQVKKLTENNSTTQKLPLELNDSFYTIKDLIREIVTIQINKYKSNEEFDLLKSLETYQTNEKLGRFRFFKRFEKSNVVIDLEINKALQAFEDEIVALFIDDIQYHQLQDSITLKEGSVLTFIRLTFLAGRGF